MSDFAPWLKNNPSRDTALAELKTFADAQHATWPYHSNLLSDYVQATVAVQPPNQPALLMTLERYFMQWRDSQRRWGLWSAEAGLLLAGVIVAIIITVALFYTDLLPSLANPDQARGLITFLFSFITITVIFIVVIALLWMDASADLELRFTKAKDIIAILVGILGTIVGFYFGSAPVRPNGGTSPPTTVTTTNNGPATGSGGTVNATPAPGQPAQGSTTDRQR